ncbi:MAG TPA: exodeoxyribonuclease VII small subunit [Candidatus Saccharimonadales bacterium]|nr:exodeoxyribonuclease VII small subunit [Candidatus Saccharimonadales bacterium]
MTKAKDYQTLSIELDEVLAKLQQPGVRVDEAVKLYEQGLELIELLEKHLQQAENKIEKLKLAATEASKA